jgi:hypothetical protein
MIAMRALLKIICFAVLVHGAIGAGRDPLTMKDPDWVDGRINETRFGNFQQHSFAIPGRKTAKGIAIRVGANGEGTYCYDTLLCSPAAGWTGGFLKFPDRRFALTGNVEAVGDIQFKTALLPGAFHGSTPKDTRVRNTMPMPAEEMRYEGLTRNRDRTLLHYSVAGVSVLETPWLIGDDGLEVFTRTFEITPCDRELSFLIASRPGGRRDVFQQGDVESVLLEDRKGLLSAWVTGGGARVDVAGDDHLIVRVPAHRGTIQLRAFIWNGTREKLSRIADLVKANRVLKPLAPLANGGFNRQWTEQIVTVGRKGITTGAFAIDTINLPFQNPYNALFFAGGHDFLPDGRALLATVHGDVWLVSGIDSDLKKIDWKRFATGLYQPLGLKVVNGRIYVLGKDQITELRDLNGDGEADHYRNFNNQNEISGGGHNYATCLETDPAGNFWFIRCNDGTPHGGTLLKVARDGSDIEVIATGFRNPNGMGVSPDGLVTAADQQGTWVPETRLDICSKGGFYGFVPSSKMETEPTRFDGPFCWIPRVLDNSAGGQTWVPKNTWGPLAEQMIHISYGRCSIMSVLKDGENPEAQGGLVPLVKGFDSGVMRGRFHTDGHLYLSGLKGWQTVGLKDGAFQRVRFTGRNLFQVTGFSLHENGVKLTFNEVLDVETANDAGSYFAETWNYLWSKNYGSDDYSVKEPGKTGRDELEVRSARVLADGRSVFIEMSRLGPAHQLGIQFNLKSASGRRARDTFYTTVNRLAPRFQ